MEIHDRMPLILAPGDCVRWPSDEPDPGDLLRVFPAEPMRMWPISTRVNKPENDDPSILEPIELSVRRKAPVLLRFAQCSLLIIHPAAEGKTPEWHSSLLSHFSGSGPCVRVCYADPPLCALSLDRAAVGASVDTQPIGAKARTELPVPWV